jgi:hypothetical protein
MSAKAKSGKNGSGVPPLNKNTEQSRDGSATFFGEQLPKPPMQEQN